MNRLGRMVLASRQASSPARRRGLLVALSLVGALAGMVLAARVRAPLGPVDARLTLEPHRSGETSVRLPPLGALHLDTHDAPVRLVASIDGLRLDDAQRVARDPDVLRELEDEAVAGVASAMRELLLRATIGALVGGALLAVVRETSWRAAATGSITALALVVALAGASAATLRRDALAEPRFTGLLSAAPRAIGSVQEVRERYDRYREQLAGLIGNVAGLYDAAAALDAYEPGEDVVRVLHVSDLHLNPQAFDVIEEVVEGLTADVVVDTGDIADWGTEVESNFAGGIGDIAVPYLYVRGNHDSAGTAAAVAAQPGARVLDRESVDVAGLRFWGAGDPRFTPDKTTASDPDDQRRAIEAFADDVARRVADEDRPPDVVLLHDPLAAEELFGEVPLVLSGHRHKPSRTDREGTILLIEGSTGGAGLRTLEGDEPVPLSCSMLYLDRETGELRAYDRITVTGLGGAGVRIERTIVDPPEADDEGDGSTTSTTSAAEPPGTTAGAVPPAAAPAAAPSRRQRARRTTA